jgi:hypothetical protein
LRIEAYFQQVHDLIDACPIIQSSAITYDKRATYEGFIHGELYFVDGSILHIREFIDVETTVDRLMYVYQYMDAAKTLAFRYDNTSHHRKFNLPTYPHHKHTGREDNIIASSAPLMSTVLDEIEQIVVLP